MFEKKKKKKVDRHCEHMVSSDSAYAESARALRAAYKIAKFNKDLEAILAISDRWTAIGRLLEEDSDNKIPMGFTGIGAGNEHDS